MQQKYSNYIFWKAKNADKRVQVYLRYCKDQSDVGTYDYTFKVETENKNETVKWGTTSTCTRGQGYLHL